MDASSPSLRKYGLTQGDYDEMVEPQNGQCMTPISRVRSRGAGL